MERHELGLNFIRGEVMVGSLNSLGRVYGGYSFILSYEYYAMFVVFSY